MGFRRFRMLPRRAYRAVRRGGIRRRGRRRGGFRLGGGLGLQRLLSRDTLQLAGGAVLAYIGTAQVLNMFGPGAKPGAFRLPGSDKPWGLIGYGVGLPVLFAALLRKQFPTLAKGMFLGGAITGVTAIVAQIQQGIRGTTTGTAAYLDAPMIPGVSASPVPSAGYSATQAFSASPLANTSAFSDNAWQE